MTVEEYYTKWKKEGNALTITNEAIPFARAYADYYLKEYLTDNPKVIRIGDTNEFT